jgi:drug/metabolite transporter (DMT)-like permease
LISFLIGSLLLGVVVSWGSTLFWNRASTLLPVALTGQLIVFETIFGLLYVFIVEQRWPTGYELLGGLLLLSGVWRGIRLADPAPH